MQKYKDFLLDNVEITLRDFNRKFSLKKVESLKVLKTIRENKLIKYHPLFEVLAKEEAKAEKITTAFTSFSWSTPHKKAILQMALFIHSYI